MSKETTDHNTESRPEWDHLEDWLRGQVQGMVQYMLEEEVTEFLGRLKSARRSDSGSGYRNGYAPPRKLTLSSGTIRVRRPRVRDTEEQFESRLPPLFISRTSRVADLIPELYLHDLSEGTSTWLCVDCWERMRRCRRARSLDSRTGGTLSLPSGTVAVSTNWRWCT